MTEPWDLPEGWEWASFQEVAQIASDLVSPADHQDEPHIAPNHIESGSGRLLAYTTIATDKVTSPKHRFRPGQILYSKIRPYLCKAVRVDFAGLCSADMYPIVAKIDADYLHRWMLSLAFTEWAAGAQGRTVLPKINQEALSIIQVPVPPLAEQRRIVAKIEELTARSRAARAALAEVPTLMDQLRQSVLAPAFRGDLTADWRAKHPDAKPISTLLPRLAAVGRSAQASRATDSSIPGDFALAVGDCELPAPDSWTWIRLTTVAKLETGHTPSRKHPEYWNGNIPWVCIKDASANHGTVVEQTLQYVTQLGLDNSAARLLPAGTVCLTRTANSIGYALVLGKPMATSQDLVGWTCSEAVAPKYLMYLFIAERAALYRFAKGSTHPTVYFPEILSFWVCLPPVEEQHEVVRLLEGALSRIEKQAESIRFASGDLERLGQSVLAKAFRGELVPQDPADEPAAALLARIRSGGTATTPSTPTRSAKRGQVKFYILLLLRTWNKPLGREMLERGLVLMLNADVRRAILGRSKPMAKRTKKRGIPPQFVSGMDALLGEMIDDGQLVPGSEAGFFAEGQHGIDFTAAPPSDLDAVREVAEVMKVLHKDKQQATDADIVSALNGEIYELVS